MQVQEALRVLKIRHTLIDLGMVELPDGISRDDRKLLSNKLLKTGLELLEDKRGILIERIKTAIIEMIHYAEEIPKTNYSGYISEKLNYDYTYLANTFSEVTGMTIQQYIINHKIEKVKELLLYDELSLGEIAFRLHYSSPAHLSFQFKKMTGVSPSFYKKLRIKRKRNLEDL